MLGTERSTRAESARNLPMISKPDATVNRKSKRRYEYMKKMKIELDYQKPELDLVVERKTQRQRCKEERDTKVQIQTGHTYLLILREGRPNAPVNRAKVVGIDTYSAPLHSSGQRAAGPATATDASKRNQPTIGD